MTTYEWFQERLKNLYLASKLAENESVAEMWWIQYLKLEQQMKNLTIKELSQLRV